MTARVQNDRAIARGPAWGFLVQPAIALAMLRSPSVEHKEFFFPNKKHRLKKKTCGVVKPGEVRAFK
jgi:hypothetical protein